jgi:hypothetical protein
MEPDQIRNHDRLAAPDECVRHRRNRTPRGSAMRVHIHASQVGGRALDEPVIGSEYVPIMCWPSYQREGRREARLERHVEPWSPGALLRP